MAKRTKHRIVKKKPIEMHIPRLISVIFTFCALLLVPWTIFLAYELPIRYVNKHWDITWVGLDIGIMFLFLLTGFLASVKSRLVILSLSAVGMVLLVDAWFDITSSRPGNDLRESVFLAIFVEIPVAIMAFVLAYRTINHNVD